MGFFDILFCLIALILLNTGIRLVLLVREMDDEETDFFVARTKMMFSLVVYAVVILPYFIAVKVKNKLKGDE